jgi:hypothetical protein
MLYPLSYRRPSNGVPDDWTRIADGSGQAESASGGGAGQQLERQVCQESRELGGPCRVAVSTGAGTSTAR